MEANAPIEGFLVSTLVALTEALLKAMLRRNCSGRWLKELRSVRDRSTGTGLELPHDLLSSACQIRLGESCLRSSEVGMRRLRLRWRSKLEWRIAKMNKDRWNGRRRRGSGAAFGCIGIQRHCEIARDAIF